jgi:hypothetical protein
MRDGGDSAQAIVGRLAMRHGLQETAAPIAARELIAGFKLPVD